MTSYRSPALGAALLYVSLACCTVGFAASSSENTLKESLNLGNYESVTYQAEDGREISSDEFFKQATSGRAFSKLKDASGRTLTLSILPPMKKGGPIAPTKLSVKPGEPMPAAAFADLGGTLRSLDGSGRKPVLISFFFAECAPCIEEVPELNAFAQANKDVSVVAVTFDAAAEARAFVEKHKLRWPVVADATDYIDKIGVHVYPTLVLVSATGKLAAFRSGDSGYVKIGEWVRSSLQGGAGQ
jgi:thiol-disulfide isomerase/thioredoxin